MTTQTLKLMVQPTVGGRLLPALAIILTLLITTMFTNTAHAQFCPPFAFPPVAEAGAGANDFEGQTVTLDASGSTDPDFNIISYKWAQVLGPAAVNFANSNNVIQNVLLPNIANPVEVMTFQVTVTDADGCSSTDTVDVTVNKANLPPVAGLTAPVAVSEGASVELDGSSSFDPNSDSLTYNWSQTLGPAVVLNLADPAKPTFVAPVTGAAYTLRFVLSVFDGQANSPSVSVDIAVSPANQIPIAVAGNNQTVSHGQLVELNGSASSDPENQPLTYSWSQIEGPSVSLDLADPAKPKFTAPSTTSTLKFSLVVNDGLANSVASEVSVFVFPAASIPNCANAKPNRKELWPPKHNMARVKIRGMEISHHDQEHANNDEDDNADDIDEDLGQVEIRILSVVQDEPTTGTGSGDTGPDAVVESVRNNGQPRLRDLVLLRKERAAGGDGRVYEIEFMAINSLSNASCTGKVQVCVPTKKGKKGTCVNSGLNYNSLQ